ncbi:hypothetical protein UY3_01089 [Chelonia mydas]|uniref:Uncharacterized protein n=1 Tax=Chelonia mydas TaxID=8469 RepID=M7BWS1_CHEMY|nr:hypothetical protein UY3_01089 [Chelonia mydas]
MALDARVQVPSTPLSGKARDLPLPSTPKTFEAAKDFIAFTAPLRVPHVEQDQMFAVPAPTAPEDWVLRDPPQCREQGTARALTLPDEVVAGMSMVPVLQDSRVLQQLMWRAVQNLGIQTEQVIETSDPMVDILAPSVPSRIALTLIKTIQDTTKALWQTPRLLTTNGTYTLIPRQTP